MTRRVIVAVPHVYNAAGASRKYGATGPDPSPRVKSLEACLTSLRSTLSSVHRFLDHGSRRIEEHLPTLPSVVDIVVCTTGPLHLLDKLSLSPEVYRWEMTNADPMYVPFECQRVLAEALGSYDYYCYVEDDIVVRDPLLLSKVSWFNEVFGPGCLLQPNRFEIAAAAAPWKLYIDGPIENGSAPFQDTSQRPELSAPVFGDTIRFVRPDNPISACYFLNAEQMQTWASRPDFFDGDASFIGPIESAASLGLMRTFAVYKPAWENADFLEVEHSDSRWWWFGVAPDGGVAPIDECVRAEENEAVGRTGTSHSQSEVEIQLSDPDDERSPSEHTRLLEALLREREETLAETRQRLSLLESHLDEVKGRAGYIILDRMAHSLHRIPALERIARPTLRRIVKRAGP